VRSLFTHCRPLTVTLFPYPTLFRSHGGEEDLHVGPRPPGGRPQLADEIVGPGGHGPPTCEHVPCPGQQLPRQGACSHVGGPWPRSEEHTSELQSLPNLASPLLLQKN